MAGGLAGHQAPNSTRDPTTQSAVDSGRHINAPPQPRPDAVTTEERRAVGRRLQAVVRHVWLVGAPRQALPSSVVHLLATDSGWMDGRSSLWQSLEESIDLALPQRPIASHFMTAGEGV